MEKRKLNNEGFSLIELIVVIAIMAILVGAMAPQVTKYIEKARVSNDKQAIGALYTAVQTATIDPDITTSSLDLTKTSADAYHDAIKETLGGTSTTAIYTTGNAGLVKLQSKAYKGASVTVTVDSNNNVTITVPTVSGYAGAERGFKVDGSGCNPIS